MRWTIFARFLQTMSRSNGQPSYSTYSRLFRYSFYAANVWKERKCEDILCHTVSVTRLISSRNIMFSGVQLCDRDSNQKGVLRDLITKWVDVLTTEHVPEPTESVHLIVAHAVGKKMIHEVDRCMSVSTNILDNINRMCEKRRERWPVQYIIGEWDFHDMTLKMEPPVLIPRPETEELALHVVDEWKKCMTGSGGVFLDIGCGSGAISVFILRSLPQAVCVVVDKNEAACNLTLHNAKLYNLQDRLHVLHADIFTDCAKKKLESHGPYDVIVSNPPYIPSRDMEVLQEEVARYEDKDALHGGSDGLDVVTQILAMSQCLLNHNHGRIWLEVDLSHPEKIQELTEKHPEYNIEYVETIQDFSKRGRFCKLKTRDTVFR